MEILLTCAFIFISVAICLIFKISSNDISKLVTQLENKNNKSFKKMMTHKENKVLNFLRQTKEMLQVTNQTVKFTFIILASVIFAVLGISIAIAIDNIYLAPAFAVAFGGAPFVYIRFQFIEYNKMVISELSSVMAAVTSSYERTENIITAFKENLEDTPEPIKSIFQSFINEIETVNPNYEKALDNLKDKIDNSIFVEWCDALKRCSRNRNIKFVLAPIVLKLSKVRIVTGELQTMLMNGVKDYWVLLAATFALLYVGIFVLPDGLMIEIPKDLSNILIAINVAVALLTSIKVIIITKEIKFDL